MSVQNGNPFAMSKDWAADYIPKRNHDYKHAPKLRWVKPHDPESPTVHMLEDIKRKLRLREFQKKRKSLRTEAHMAVRKIQGTCEATGVHRKVGTKNGNTSYLERKKNKNTPKPTLSKILDTTYVVAIAKQPSESNNNVAVPVAEEKKRGAFQLTSLDANKELAMDRAYVAYSMKMTETAMYFTKNLSLWSNKLKAYAFIPATVAGEIESTVGKSKLLLDSKIPQFANLLNLYLNREDAVKPVLVSDLEGWWDAFNVELGKLKFSFSVLEMLQENNWQPLDSDELGTEIHINIVAKRTTYNGTSRKKPRKSSPAILQFLAGKREEMRQSAKLGELHPEVLFVTSSNKDPSNLQPGASKEGSDTLVSTPPRPLNKMPVEIELFCTPDGSLNGSLLGPPTVTDSPGVHYSLLKKKLQFKRRLSREGSRRASMAMLALGNALNQTSQKVPPNNSDTKTEGNSSVMPETIRFASALGGTFTRAQDNFKLLTSAVSRSRWNPWK